MTELPTRQIANFIFESESELHILTVFYIFTASSKDNQLTLKNPSLQTSGSTLERE